MNKSTAANIAQQARSSAAAGRRAAKNAKLSLTLIRAFRCEHPVWAAWSVPGYTGQKCLVCGTNEVLTVEPDAID